MVEITTFSYLVSDCPKMNIFKDLSMHIFCQKRFIGEIFIYL